MKHCASLLALLLLSCPPVRLTAQAQDINVSSIIWNSMQTVLEEEEEKQRDSIAQAAADTLPAAVALDSSALLASVPDSLTLAALPDSLLTDSVIAPPTWRDTLAARMAETYIFPVYLTMVFQAHPMQFDLKPQVVPSADAAVPASWPGSVSDGQRYVDTVRTAAMLAWEARNIDRTVYTMNQLPKNEKVEIRIKEKGPDSWKVVPNKQMDMHISTENIPGNTDFDYSNWTFAGRLSAQLSQTYISPNWSSGGTSNNSALMSVYLTANYNDRKLIQFDNVLDLQIGLNTNPSDSLRSLSIATDQLQISSKLGIKAFNNWYYSLQAELITQTLQNYKENTRDLKSAFLSPAKFFVSLGLDYKLQQSDKKLSVLFTPLTYKVNYLMDNVNINPTKYGIDEGCHFGHEFGIKLSTTYDWKISDAISWNTYFYYYSNFNYIDSEWKNTLNFALTRFFTAQLFVHLRFDDRVARTEENSSLLQLKEILSLGFTYHLPSFRRRK